MTDEIRIFFSPNPGQVINVKSLLSDGGYIGLNDTEETSKMSSILRKVHSKIGKVVAGYDEGDGFIDDTEVADAATESTSINENAFKVVLSYKEVKETPTTKQSVPKPRSEDTLTDNKQFDELLSDYHQKITTTTCDLINEKLNTIHAGNSKNNNTHITLTPEMVEAIVECVDERVKLETQAHQGSLPKRKIEQWRKDALTQIYQRHFTVFQYTFTTLRKIQMAYGKYKKDHDNTEQPTKGKKNKENKEMPVLQDQPNVEQQSTEQSKEVSTSQEIPSTPLSSNPEPIPSSSDQTQQQSA